LHDLGGLISVVAKDVKGQGPVLTFELLDFDGSGEITKEEYEKGFDLINQNKSGFITESEFSKVSNCWTVTVKLLDKDGDGKISRSEWNAGFALFDLDGDGLITKSEFYLVSESGFAFEMLDFDGDGRISQEEYNMGFDILDEDHDGFITRSEFGNATKAYFDLLDKDGDNKISREEYNEGFALMDTDRDGFIDKTEFSEFIYPPEEEENQEYADRRYALQDRDDPRVAEIDALIAELSTQYTKRGTHPYLTWRDDAKMAEHIFLRTPEQLPAWLKRMRTKNLSKQEKRERVQALAVQLARDAITAIPPEQWTSEVQAASESVVETKTPEEGGGAESPPVPEKEITEDEAAAKKESAILRRLGFIFIAYRMEYWWWEGMEMFRKFLMTWSSLSTPPSPPPFPRRLSPPLLLPCLCVSLLFRGLLASCVMCPASHPDVCSPCVACRQSTDQIARTCARQLPGVPAGGWACAVGDRGYDHLHLPLPQPHLSALLHGHLKQTAVLQPGFAVHHPLLRHPHRMDGSDGQHRI
jgi:Ca2+-binding EF-hand superfamily protein